MIESASTVDHYGTDDLIVRVDEGLRAAGLGDGIIPWETLAPLDQFHAMGLAATAELADRLSIRAGDRVLDVGSGLGGPARYLASRYGCSVTGIDLSGPFVDLATMLTRRTGLSERAQFRRGDALSLPFAPGSFDLAVTQHVAMNIADRAGFYAGIFRVLRPGGRLGIYDVVAGEGGPLHFPMPWARLPENSFVISAEAMRVGIEAAGFVLVECIDRTEAARSWWRDQAAARAGGAAPAALSLPLVMGPEFPGMVANLGRNLVEGRAGLVQAIAVRPA